MGILYFWLKTIIFWKAKSGQEILSKVVLDEKQTYSFRITKGYVGVFPKGLGWD
jgi:hypothetical protein